jgi:ribosomal protein S18 acetylase RimI-like enzyme
MAGALPITEDHVTKASEAMARAFFDDPLQQYFLPDEHARLTLGAPFFAAMLRYGHLFGQTYTNASAGGAAVWLPPGETDMTDERVAASGMADASQLIGDEAFGRFAGVMEFLEPLHKRDVPPEHWYLAVIGVDTALHGQGIGCSLMQPVLAKADEQGLPCYLETANAANVEFYRRRGFDVQVEAVDPTSNLRLWTFRRDPR